MEQNVEVIRYHAQSFTVITAEIFGYIHTYPLMRVSQGFFGNKGTLVKYRREQGNISQFLGKGEQNSKNYSTKIF